MSISQRSVNVCLLYWFMGI